MPHNGTITLGLCLFTIILRRSSAIYGSVQVAFSSARQTEAANQYRWSRQTRNDLNTLCNSNYGRLRTEDLGRQSTYLKEVWHFRGIESSVSSRKKRSRVLRCIAWFLLQNLLVLLLLLKSAQLYRM